MMTSFVLAPLGMVVLGGLYLLAQRAQTDERGDSSTRPFCCNGCDGHCAERTNTTGTSTER